MDVKYKFEVTVMASGLFMLLTMYEMPVASYFKTVEHFSKLFGKMLKETFHRRYERCFQDVAAQLLMPLTFQILIPTYMDNDGTALFWILDLVEYFMYCTTIFLVKRVVTLLHML